MRLLRFGTVVSLLVAACFAADSSAFRTQVSISRPAGAAEGSNANVVVWLTPLDAPPAPAPIHARLVQKNKQFEPRLVVVPVGSSVEFPNLDPFFHNVFSLYNGKRFDLGLYEAGGSRSVRFDRLGVSFIFCNIHPEMSAAVVVVPTNYYAISDRNGEVVINDLPAGRYRMQVWYDRSSPEALSALSREVVLPAQSQLATLRVPEVVTGAIAHRNKYGKEYETSPSYKPPQ